MAIFYSYPVIGSLVNVPRMYAKDVAHIIFLLITFGVIMIDNDFVKLSCHFFAAWGCSNQTSQL